jgi:beta-galactosidase/beta-glucuronidase
MAADPPALAHPRPQLTRERWTSLDGSWDFAIDPDGVLRTPDEVPWGGTITVPFAPEAPLSGVGETGFFRACWYRRFLDAAPPPGGGRLLLHFGAVDHAATVWVNGAVVARHSGGYTPFHADVTPHLRAEGPQTVVVRAQDDPHDLAKPRGKQDWQLEPHAMWYPRTSGIWQTVWTETVPSSSIARVGWTSNLERWEIALDAEVGGVRRDDLRLRVRLTAGERLLADDTYAVLGGEVHRRIAPSDPGIDDYRNELLWSPARPTLIDAALELVEPDGTVLDRARSYTAMRSIGVGGGRFLLNGRPYPLRLVLDQGYWPDGGLTAPDDAALRRDVELVKEMGFNGVRKHQKLEAPRYLRAADELGLLVWVEMPSAYRFTGLSVARVSREWTEAVERDRSHPCVVAWVTMNESWGAPDLPSVEEQRHWVQALYHLTKSLDPLRPVIGNDGWESSATDIIGIHDYDEDPHRLAARYASAERLPNLFARERPGGRALLLEEGTHAGQPVMLTEFGGIGMGAGSPDAWSYSDTADERELAERYRRLLTAVRSLSALAGFCYTQFTDVYQEHNGLLRFDRTPKFPLDEIARATYGAGWRGDADPRSAPEGDAAAVPD